MSQMPNIQVKRCLPCAIFLVVLAGSFLTAFAIADPKVFCFTASVTAVMAAIIYCVHRLVDEALASKSSST